MWKDFKSFRIKGYQKPKVELFCSKHTHTHIYIYTHAQTYTHTYTYIHTHTYTNSYIHTCTHAYIHIHIYTHIHTCPLPSLLKNPGFPQVKLFYSKNWESVKPCLYISENFKTTLLTAPSFTSHTFSPFIYHWGFSDGMVVKILPGAMEGP